ncbi:MAG: hypothetical protein HKN91_02795 [Acidimicrobiia bacterium]|nr:hypothetical protein [Acidimicrobiia bacterium]
MRPTAPDALLARATEWEDLTRWERAELGRALRRLGWTYREIREVIPVPKGTLSGWCAEVELTEEQVSAIAQRTATQAGVPRDTQWRRRLEKEAIRAEAREQVGAFVQQPLWVAGVVMYWAEGSKTTNRLTLSNTDPAALRLFVDWTRAYLDSEAEFVLSLHLHHGNDEAAAKAYWAPVIAPQRASFTKTYIKPPGTRHRKNHLAHGVCRVAVRRSANHIVRVKAWYRALPAALDSSR